MTRRWKVSWLGLLLACALFASACDQLVSVEVREVDLPEVDAFAQSFVYAADGTQIATFRFSHREPVEREDLPDHLVTALVDAEDRRFWDHEGVDPRAVVRAFVANRQAGEVVQGGSTLTQQLVKNRYFPDPENTIERKLLEARLAWELEQDATKDEILTEYLNTVYFGAGAHGIEAAAQVYFDTTTTELSLAQSALLVAIIRSPEAANPFTAPDRARAERTRVLDALTRNGDLSEADRDELDAAPLGLTEPPEAPPVQYPFFVEYVKRQLVGDEHFGVDEAHRWRRLFGGGLRIHTTIDPAVQAAADAASTAFWSGAEDPEVAISVVDPATGHIAALVGGRDFATSQFDLATQGRRQPGSTFKVFALTAALSRGWTLDSVIESGPGSFDVGDPEPWTVRSGTTGEITLREALVRSSNGAFARLALELGPGAVEHMAHSMGVRGRIGSNPSIVLGGLSEGVSPLDMASAFGTLANGGVHAAPTAVTHITDADGNVVWEPRGLPVTVVDPETAWLVTDTMQQVVTEGTGRAASLGERPSAGKTGTVQENRDAWFVGFTREYSTAVWIGYPDRARPLVDVHGVAAVQGGTWPARIWQRFMSTALEGRPIQPLRYPHELAVTVEIDPETGGIATPFCPVTETLTALPAELPTFSCPLHQHPPLPTPDPSASPSTTPGTTPSPSGGPQTAPPDPGVAPAPPATPTPAATPTGLQPTVPASPSPSPTPTPTPTTDDGPQAPPDNTFG